MKRNLIAAMTAAAFAISTLTATPAAANNKNDISALEAILGVIALGVIVNELDKDKSRGGRQNSGFSRYKVIPTACVFPVRGHKGRSDVVSSRCLRNSGVKGPYPNRCAFDIRTRYGRQTVFGTRCMQNYGYRIGGRRR
ncbi:MAG: hypothetical protein R3E44_00870 [Paracoccaceae bacterium]